MRIQPNVEGGAIHAPNNEQYDGAWVIKALSESSHLNPPSKKTHVRENPDTMKTLTTWGRASPIRHTRLDNAVGGA